MDRFIDESLRIKTKRPSDLKSSMDRFIVHNLLIITAIITYLKSSMDRFIEDYGFRSLR